MTEIPELFRLGVLNVLPRVNQKDAQVAIEMNYARRNKEQFPEMKFKMEILPDLDEAVVMFQRKQLHSILLTSLDYLALKEKAQITPLLVASRQDSPLESYVIVTKKEITSLDQLSLLQQRRIIMEDFGEINVGHAWLDTVLWEHDGRSSKSFFTAIKKENKPTQLVLPVFFGQAEACLVPESVFQTMGELNPQIRKRLKVLLRSPGFVRSVYCTCEGLNSGLVEAIVRNATQIAKTTDGQQLLMIFQVKRRFLYKPEYLEASRRIYEKHRHIRKVF